MVSFFNKKVSDLALLFIISTVFIPANSWSQSANEIDKAIFEQDRLQKFQEQKIRSENLDREKNRILKGPNILKIEQIKKAPEKESGKCFDVKEIRLLSITVMSKSDQKKIINPYLNKCININQINDLMRQITNFYVEKGFVTSKAFIGEQDLSKGILELRITEGKIEDIIINDDSIFDKVSAFGAFPFFHNSILNLKDIEQGLSQLNRLDSNSSTIQILPGSKPEYSIVKITNQKTKGRTNLEYNVSNYGQKSTGEKVENFSFSNDNLLGINDFLNVNYSDNLGGLKKDKYTKSLYGSLNVPLGYFNFSGSISNSEYVTSFGNSGQTFTTRGSTDINQIGIDYSIYRARKLQVTLNSDLKTKDTKSFIRSTLSDVGSRKLTIMDLGFTANIYGDYGILNLKPNLANGLRILDAKKDEANLPNGTPRAQFRALQLSGFYSKSFNIPKTTFPITFTANFDSQISNDNLFGSEQFYVGSRYSVRGFDEQSSNAENGAYIQNNFKFNLKDLLKTNNQFANQYLLNPISLTVFYDTGFVRPKSLGNTSYLSGTGTAISFNHKYFAADFGYYKSIRRPAKLANEGSIIDFRMKFKLNLF